MKFRFPWLFSKPNLSHTNSHYLSPVADFAPSSTCCHNILCNCTEFLAWKSSEEVSTHTRNMLTTTGHMLPTTCCQATCCPGVNAVLQTVCVIHQCPLTVFAASWNFFCFYFQTLCRLFSTLEIFYRRCAVKSMFYLLAYLFGGKSQVIML